MFLPLCVWVFCLIICIPHTCSVHRDWKKHGALWSHYIVLGLDQFLWKSRCSTHNKLSHEQPQQQNLHPHMGSDPIREIIYTVILNISGVWAVEIFKKDYVDGTGC